MIVLPARLTSEKNASVPSAYFRYGACLRRAVPFADGLQLRLRVHGQTCCRGPCAWFYLILWTTPAPYTKITKAYQKHRCFSCFGNFQPTRPQVVAALLSTLVVLDFAPKKRGWCDDDVLCYVEFELQRLSWTIPESDQEAAQSWEVWFLRNPQCCLYWCCNDQTLKSLSARCKILTALSAIGDLFSCWVETFHILGMLLISQLKHPIFVCQSNHECVPQIWHLLSKPSLVCRIPEAGLHMGTGLEGPHICKHWTPQWHCSRPMKNWYINDVLTTDSCLFAWSMYFSPTIRANLESCKFCLPQLEEPADLPELRTPLHLTGWKHITTLKHSETICHMGVSKNRGNPPQIMNFNRGFPL